jgi:hypothetical protein
MKLSLSALFFCLVLAACGGGGGGGDGGGSGGEGTGGGETLDSYAYNFSLPVDNPLQISSSEGSITLGAMDGVGPISGSYTLDTETITLNGGPMMKVTTDLFQGSAAVFWVNVDTPVEASGGNSPYQGVITVHVGAPTAYSVTVTISAAGFHLVREGYAAVDLTFDQFDAVVGSSAPEWQQAASLACAAVGVVFSQLTFDIEAIRLIEEHDSTLAKESVVVNGDTFPGTPPPGSRRHGHADAEQPERQCRPGRQLLPGLQ